MSEPAALRCDGCGRFVADRDFEGGGATHKAAAEKADALEEELERRLQEEGWRQQEVKAELAVARRQCEELGEDNERLRREARDLFVIAGSERLAGLERDSRVLGEVRKAGTADVKVWCCEGCKSLAHHVDYVLAEAERRAAEKGGSVSEPSVDEIMLRVERRRLPHIEHAHITWEEYEVLRAYAALGRKVVEEREALRVSFEGFLNAPISWGPGIMRSDYIMATMRSILTEADRLAEAVLHED
jgi:hypothetical protein